MEAQAKVVDFYNAEVEAEVKNLQAIAEAEANVNHSNYKNA